MNDARLDALAARLQETLPGPDAHLRMISSRYAGSVRPRPRDDARRSAVLILLYPNGEDIYLPLIRRQTYRGVHSGQIGLPGGRTEPTDPSPEATALREAEEEVGVRPGDVRVLGRLSELYVPPSNFLIHPVVGVIDYRPAFVPEPQEVAEVIEAPLAEFTHNDPPAETTITAYPNVKVRTPYYDVRNEVVWGATAMMMSEFAWLWREASANFR